MVLEFWFGHPSAIFGTPKIAKNTQNDPEADKEVEQVAKEAADTLEAVVEALCWRSTSLYNQWKYFGFI